MFERFTDRARRVVVLAAEEARMLDHDWIGTEHLLLGLVREGEGVAALALTSMGISIESVRRDVEEMIGRGETTSAGHIPFTPRSKKVLELALQEALQFGHDYIGTEHILLGLIREGDGVAAQVLVSLGANLERVRTEVLRLLETYTGGPVMREVARRPSLLATHQMSRASAPTCPNCFAGLDDVLVIREVKARETDDEPSRVKIAYCGRCGVALGTVT